MEEQKELNYNNKIKALEASVYILEEHVKILTQSNNMLKHLLEQINASN